MRSTRRVIQTVACEVDSENVSAVSFIGELILFHFNDEDDPIETNVNSDENMDENIEDKEEETAAENGASTSQAVRMTPYKHTSQAVRMTPYKHTSQAVRMTPYKHTEEDDSTGPDDDDNDVHNDANPADVHNDNDNDDRTDDINDDADVTLEHDICEDDDDDDDEATLSNKYKVILRSFRQWLASMDGQCTNCVTAQMYITSYITGHKIYPIN